VAGSSFIASMNTRKLATVSGQASNGRWMQRSNRPAEHPRPRATLS
jgi:hypothetical protein